MLGYFSDEQLPLLYGGAEVFIFPSLAEDFGLPVLEAMACGTQVICSNTTSMPEVAGEAARLVPSLKVEAWVEALDRVASDEGLRWRIRENGLKRASQFSWDSAVENVRRVSEEL
jgi:alpha-1,3-rhamnosyl/mannosyltransferase